ncbi:hypothetical protein OGATHE_001289 [Ogataea polymorpha]|uniref:Uncharacterized protein n=1 Tax=Ogataea polymorpha TaxID=460523 RepID=A0A9P8PT27_9ASCO|nr:hypothetical protein OGATHE_001289 [Ogataea polymorpha]
MVSVSMAIGSVMVTLKAEKDVIIFVSGSLEIGIPGTKRTVSRPDQFAITSENVRSRLTGFVEGVSRGPRKRSNKEVFGRDFLCVVNGDVQFGRSQIWPTAVLPVGVRWKSKEKKCAKHGRIKMYSGVALYLKIVATLLIKPQNHTATKSCLDRKLYPATPPHLFVI